MARRITPSIGTGDFQGFSWPPLDSKGNLLPQTTVHTWQCQTCGQTVGQHIRSDRNSVVELLTQCIETIRQHRQSHTVSIDQDQPQLLAAD